MHLGDESTEFCDSDDEGKFDEKCLPIYEVSSEDPSENEVEEPMIGPQLQPRCQSIPRADSSMFETVEKLSHESMGTFVAHECACGADCTRHFSRDQIRPLREATVAMEQQGQKLCNIALKVVNVCKENVPICGETKFDFKICSVSVCEDVFRLAHGLSASAMKIAKAAARKNLAVCPLQPRKKKAFSSSQSKEEKSGKSERAEQCLDWAKDWIDLHGCKMPDSNLVYVDDVSLSRSPQGILQGHECTLCAIARTTIQEALETKLRQMGQEASEETIWYLHRVCRVQSKIGSECTRQA